MENINEKNENKNEAKEKQNNNDIKKNNNNSFKRFLEILISLTPEKKEKKKNEKSEKECNENKFKEKTNKSSDKKLESLLTEIKKIEKEKKKLIQNKQKTETNINIDKNNKKNLRLILNYEMKKNIEIIEEESNMRMESYNKFFDFIFDTLNQINEISKDINIKLIEEEYINKNELNNNISTFNCNTSSLFISSLNDDFYKKLLDITKSIISSSRTIKMNESILFDNTGNKVDDKEMTPQIKSKNIKIFKTHPNDILNKLNQKYRCNTNYLKCKYNSHYNNNDGSNHEEIKNNTCMNKDNNSKNNCLLF